MNDGLEIGIVEEPLEHQCSPNRKAFNGINQEVGCSGKIVLSSGVLIPFSKPSKRYQLMGYLMRF